MRKEKSSSKLRIAASHYNKEEQYWLDKFSGKVSKSHFPYDNSENIEMRNIDTVNFRIPGDLCTRILHLSDGFDQVLHMVFAAGIIALLDKYTYCSSSNREFLIGAPIYKQDTEGDFINTVLPLRCRLNDQDTFKDLLLRVREVIIEAVENQNYPMETLLYKLNLPFSENDFPLFDVVVLLRNVHHKEYILHTNPGILFSFLRVAEYKYIECEVEYNSYLYKKSTIGRITGNFVILMEEAIFDVNQRIDSIDFLAKEEKKQLLFDFNDTNQDYLKDKLIHELFEEQVEKTPDYLALICGDEQTTYNELNERANRLAGLLRERGVSANSIVGIMVESSIEMAVGIMGILKSGGAYLPLDPGIPRERILSILEDSQVSVLLTHSSVSRKFSFSSYQDRQLRNVKYYLTPSRNQATDLDSLPFPDRSSVDYEKYNRYIGQALVKNSISLQATRGCPYNCAYCHKIWPKKNVVRSAENIFAEVQLYYNLGVRRFSFVDDIFNLNINNSRRFFQLILESGSDVQLFFPNGLRGDILTKDYIDLLVKAGTVDLALALETASPRLQELINRHLNIEKLRENIEYFCERYPHIILELFTMHGFPTETKEEAKQTLDFIKSIKWIHFPYIGILKVYPNTDMEKLALENGISAKAIANSDHLAGHELPDTLPFDKAFTLKYQADFLNNYFLAKDRLLHVLPYQMRVLTEDEIVQKYDSYFPFDINSFDDLLNFLGIPKQELGIAGCLDEKETFVPDLGRKIKGLFPGKASHEDAIKVLLLDLSQFFSSESNTVYNVVEAPLGLMYLLTYLKDRLGSRIKGKIAKSFIDFDNYDELKQLCDEFKPDVIGIRTLNFYKKFFHQTAAMIRQWGITVPIIAGGPYGTSAYKRILQDKNIDVIVLGEGEKTFCELIEKILANDKELPDEKTLKEIAGIAFVPGGEKFNNEYALEEIVLDKLERDIFNEPGENIEHINQPGDLAYVIFTSGSSGRPKGVLVEHKNAVNALLYRKREYSINPRTTALQLFSYAFDGFVTSFFTPVISGARVILLNQKNISDITRIRESIIRNSVTHFICIPALYRVIIKSIMPQEAASMKVITLAGDKVTADIVRTTIEKNRNIEVAIEYGVTEAGVMSTLYRNQEKDNVIKIGKPIGNTQLYILNKENMLMPVGGPGELCISGAGLDRGYLNKPSLTAEKFIENPDSSFITHQSTVLYRTGDLARWLADGNIEFLGRIDQQVKLRGYRVETGEIENQIKKIEHINDVIVVALENTLEPGSTQREEDEKYLCAYYAADQEGKFDSSLFRQILSNILPDYMIPSFFIRLDEFPLTTNGKLDRKALPRPGLEPGDRINTPGNKTEEKLLEIWSDVFGIKKEKISIDADFFELGGHSLKAAIMTNTIQKELNVKLTLKEVFKFPTIRGLAKQIEESREVKFVSIEPSEKKEYYFLTSQQKRLYILQKMDVTRPGYNISMVEYLGEGFKTDKLEKIFRSIIARHESLRTSFEIINDEPVQKIHGEVGLTVEYYEAGRKGIEEIIENFKRPFDLSHPPLMRVGLIGTVEGNNILVIDMHHVITDGMSYEILKNEFMALYSGEELPELRLQYKDYPEWQNRQEYKDLIRKQENYWLNEFSGDIPVINLPLDYLRTRVQDFKGISITIVLGKEETRVLKELAKEENVTLYMILFSILSILLSKICSQADIIIGTTTLGRRHDDLRKIVGMFVNTLAVRNYVDEEKRFIDFLSDVNNRILENFENQDYPFEQLVEKIAGERDLSRNPLFDVMFDLHQMDNVEHEIDESNTNLFRYKKNTSSIFDILFTAIELRENVILECNYTSQLFKQETIKGLLNNYREIVRIVIESREIKLKEIKISHQLLEAKPQQVKMEVNF